MNADKWSQLGDKMFKLIVDTKKDAHAGISDMGICSLIILLMIVSS